MGQRLKMIFKGIILGKLKPDNFKCLALILSEGFIALLAKKLTMYT